jgi:hypothetical protein
MMTTTMTRRDAAPLKTITPGLLKVSDTPTGCVDITNRPALARLEDSQ